MDLKALHALPTGGLTKTLRIMKLTAIILLSACLTASANGFSQKVTLSEKNARLEKVFTTIKQQTGYEFLYTYEMLQKADRITINLKSVELHDALNIIFKDQPLTFSIIERTVVVKPKSGLPVKEELPQPPITVRGRVIDENGEGVVASVLVKGTSNGITSNSDGYFVLNNVDENATLVISGVTIEGTLEVKVNNKADVGEIVTTKKVGNLNEVIVKRGYWEEKKNTMVGNVSRVDAKLIERQPVTNPMATLQGRMPGVYVQQTTGLPGGAYNIEIRGQNSLRRATNDNGNLPLYVVDGVPFTSTSIASGSSNEVIQGVSPLNSIDPSNIESIEILKDADATAIYGSRGANGVVLITTKKGKAGKTKVSINFNTGFSKVPHMMDLLNTQQYLEMRREAFVNDGVTPNSFHYDVNGTWDTTRYTDWQQELIGGTSHNTNAQASISGGNSNTQFLVGLGHFRETTVFPGDFNYHKSSVHFNINHASENRRLSLLFSGTYTLDDNNLPRTDLTTKVILAPNSPKLYNDDGTLNWQNNTFANPISALQNKYNSNSENLNVNMNLNYLLLKGVTVRTRLGYTKLNLKEIQTNPIKALSPAFQSMGATGSASFANNSARTWIIEPQVEYKRSIAAGKFTVLFGSTFQQSISEGQSINASGYRNDALLENPQAGTSFSISSNYTLYRYAAVFGRINYNYKEKFLLNITGRRDGSSRFGPGKQFGNFGAVGAGWVFSEEEYIRKGLPFLSYGKLRSSYGATGSDQIPNYGFMDTYSSTTQPYNGIGGLIPTRLVNPDFSWETNKKFEVALELGFLNDRFFVSGSWYRNRSSNQLVGYALPVVTGFSTVQFNLPATVQNTGLELELSSTNIKSKNLTWTTDLNFTIPRNKLISFPNLEAYPTYVNTYSVGKPLSIVRRYHYTGVNPQTGLYDFQDVDGNGSLNALDRQFLKESGRRFYGGLQNSITYKNLSLHLFIQFVKQTGSTYMLTFPVPGTIYQNQQTLVMNRWRKPGDNTDVQKFTQNAGSATGTAYSNARFTGDNSIMDASFGRLKNVVVEFQAPKKWITKLKIQNARLYIQGQNLFTITNFIGFDPENLNSLALPPLRTFTFGMQVTL